MAKARVQSRSVEHSCRGDLAKKGLSTTSIATVADVCHTATSFATMLDMHHTATSIATVT